jgi:hypothetical protein
VLQSTGSRGRPDLFRNPLDCGKTLARASKEAAPSKVPSVGKLCGAPVGRLHDYPRIHEIFAATSVRHALDICQLKRSPFTRKTHPIRSTVSVPRSLIAFIFATSIAPVPRGRYQTATERLQRTERSSWFSRIFGVTQSAPVLYEYTFSTSPFLAFGEHPSSGRDDTVEHRVVGPRSRIVGPTRAFDYWSGGKCRRYISDDAQNRNIVTLIDLDMRDANRASYRSTEIAVDRDEVTSRFEGSGRACRPTRLALFAQSDTEETVRDDGRTSSEAVAPDLSADAAARV